MDKKLEDTLYNIDPIFFEEAIACINGEMTEMNTCMAFGCECGDGWFEPIATLARKTKILNELGKQYNVKFVCNQIKEKWGILTIYSSSMPVDEAEEDFDEADTLEKLFSDAVQSAMEEATSTCEFCGYKIKQSYDENPIVQTNGWIHRICEKCARELSNEKIKKTNSNKITDLSKGSGYGFLSLFESSGFDYKEIYYSNFLLAYIKNCNVEGFDSNEVWIKELLKANEKNITYLYTFIRTYIFGKFNANWDIQLLKDLLKAKFTYEYNKNIRNKFLSMDKIEVAWMNNFCENVLGACSCFDCKGVEQQHIWADVLNEVHTELKSKKKSSHR
jgi:hypothetical protein